MMQAVYQCQLRENEAMATESQSTVFEQVAAHVLALPAAELFIDYFIFVSFSLYMNIRLCHILSTSYT